MVELWDIRARAGLPKKGGRESETLALLERFHSKLLTPEEEGEESKRKRKLKLAADDPDEAAVILREEEELGDDSGWYAAPFAPGSLCCPSPRSPDTAGSPCPPSGCPQDASCLEERSGPRPTGGFGSAASNLYGTPCSWPEVAGH